MYLSSINNQHHPASCRNFVRTVCEVWLSNNFSCHQSTAKNVAEAHAAGHTLLRCECTQYCLSSLWKFCISRCIECELKTVMNQCSKLTIFLWHQKFYTTSLSTMRQYSVLQNPWNYFVEPQGSIKHRLRKLF